MDWLSFISSAISSLAWPITIIFSVLVLKDPIVKLIPYVRRFQYKDLNVEFGEMAEKAEIALPSELGGIIDHMRVPISVLQEIAEVSPKSAVIEAWRSVEFELLLRNELFMISCIFYIHTEQVLTCKKIHG